MYQSILIWKSIYELKCDTPVINDLISVFYAIYTLKNKKINITAQIGPIAKLSQLLCKKLFLMQYIRTGFIKLA